MESVSLAAVSTVGEQVTGPKPELTSGNKPLIRDGCITLKQRNKDFFFLPELCFASMKYKSTVIYRATGGVTEGFLEIKPSAKGIWLETCTETLSCE